MPQARSTHVSLEATPYYHCTCRCVRRAYLWGTDQLTSKDYSHRKQWVIDRLATLTRVFAIEVCSYAVMSNHYHVVVKINRDKALQWNDTDVIHRWQQLFGVPVLVEQYKQGRLTSRAAKEQAQATIEQWRARLYDLSWFMRCFNEYLARRANKEDQCRGRFWEGRFTSQALLDEAGLLTCMAYVDLNPIRAKMADTPEKSDFTSIQQRIRKQTKRKRPTTQATLKKKFNFRSSNTSRTITVHTEHLPLAPFKTRHNDHKDPLPFHLSDYLELVDWSGRAIREDKRGFIADTAPPILNRLNIDHTQWCEYHQRKGPRFSQAVGHLTQLREYARRCGKQWIAGLRASERLFPLS